MEYKYRRQFGEDKEEWCLTSFCVSERVNGEPETVVMMIRSMDEPD